MARSRNQIERLVRERNILENYFPGRVTWRNSTTLDTTVEIAMTSNSNERYLLRVYIPHDYPNSCPQMVMVSPKLRLQNGQALPSVSATFHTIGERDGHTVLCHFIPDEWTSENTLYLVFMKGRLWIEGYEGHLNTGEDIDFFLKHQRHAQQAEATPVAMPVARPEATGRPATPQSKRCVLS